MKSLILALFLLPLAAGAQTITTIIGSSSAGYGGDGLPATAASMNAPWGLARDAAGNFYIADYTNKRVRKVDPAGIITTFAGNGTAVSGGDGGPATAAGINGPTGIVVFGTDVYIAEVQASKVRKVDASGIITTYAGNGTTGFSGDGGPATIANISTPNGLGVDNLGNIYIPDQGTNHIRKVNTSGIISTIAGTGVAGYTGDGGPATLATMRLPNDVTVDAFGNVFFVDFLNNAIRKIDPSGIITTYAGTGVAGYSGDGGPATAAQMKGPGGVLTDAAGNLYIGVADNHAVRVVNTSGIINTIAGTGSPGFSGDGGAPAMAMLNRPNKVALDPMGNVYVGDMNNNRVRKIMCLPPPSAISGASALCLGSTTTLSDTAAGGTWTSAATAIAPVSAAGIVSGIAAGSSTISYTIDNGCGAIMSVSLSVMVDTTPNAGIITGIDSVCPGHTITLSDTAAGGVWSSVNTSLATVLGTAGVVTGIAAGRDTIRYIVTNACGADTTIYSVKIRSLASCPTGVSDNAASGESINIFPNPANQTLTITSPDRITTIVIYNLLGQSVYNNACDKREAEIDVSALANGIYLIKIDGTILRRFRKE
jgi:sugar lactone lactonase YvrE